MISTFENQKNLLKTFLNNGDGFDDYQKFGLYHLNNWETIYSYEEGLNMEIINSDNIL